MRILFHKIFVLNLWFLLVACQGFESNLGEWTHLGTAIKPSTPPGILGNSIPGLAESCFSEIISITGCQGEPQIVLESENVYNIVEIGGMCWFAENLKEIPTYFLSSPQWKNNSNNGWYGYPSDFRGRSFQNNGYLYTWAAAMNFPSCTGTSSFCEVSRLQGACPLGWHVPSDCEFKVLEGLLGMSKEEQGKFGWRDSGGVGDPLKGEGSSGFDAFMSSYRNGEGGFFNVHGLAASFWLSTEASESAAIARILGLEEDGIFYPPEGRNKADGRHVRCLKD